MVWEPRAVEGWIDARPEEDGRLSGASLVVKLGAMERGFQAYTESAWEEGGVIEEAASEATSEEEPLKK